MDTKGWFTWVFQNYSTAQIRLFCIRIWLIWSCRNRFVHEGQIIEDQRLGLISSNIYWKWRDQRKNSIPELRGLYPVTFMTNRRLYLLRCVFLPGLGQIQIGGCSPGLYGGHYCDKTNPSLLGGFAIHCERFGLFGGCSSRV